MDIQTSAADEIRKTIDKRTITVLSAAVPAANTVEVTGATLTEEALNEAISMIEDLELSVKTIVMRGRRFNDLRGWNLDPQTKADLRAKGVIKNYGTGSILLTAAQALEEILLVPDQEVGPGHVVAVAQPVVGRDRKALALVHVGHAPSRRRRPAPRRRPQACASRSNRPASASSRCSW